MSDDVPVCLTIGSSDSGGGAGIQGDIKAYASVGCFATTVVVGVTAQNTGGITGRWGVPVPAVLEQIDAVRAGFPLRAVKIGTTWSAELLYGLTEPVRRFADEGVPVVVDPVMVSTSGSWLSQVARTRAVVIETLLPAAVVITPNRREAELLAGVEPGTATRRDLAEELAALGAAAVVVTGGPGEPGDWFFDGTGHRHINGARYENGAEHGAGCAHSTLLAGLMAHGCPLPEAVAEAHRRAAAAVRYGHTHLGTAVHPVDVLGIGSVQPGLRWPLSAPRPLDPGRENAGPEPTDPREIPIGTPTQRHPADAEPAADAAHSAREPGHAGGE